MRPPPRPTTSKCSAYAASLVRAGRVGPARETLQKMIDATDTSAAAASNKAWARRLLAELIAERGNFREMEQAMAILRANVDESGEMAIDDLLLQVKLLTARPEPASWKQAITVLEEIARRQPLAMGQRIMMAQLLEKVGRWSEARNELMSVIAAPSVPPAYVAMLVEKMIDHGEVVAARPWLARLRKATPDSAVTLALEAKLAIADNDRELAKESARKLMPGGVVSASEPAQLAAVARLMEQLGFAKAADSVLRQFAETSTEGLIARAEFLGRQQQPDEALELLESRWNDLPLERLLTTAVQVVRVQESPAEIAPRLDGWFTKAKRIDPGSVVIKLLEAEKLNLERRDADAEAIYRELVAVPDMDATQRAIVANNLAFHLAARLRRRGQEADRRGDRPTRTAARSPRHPGHDPARGGRACRGRGGFRGGRAPADGREVSPPGVGAVEGRQRGGREVVAGGGPPSRALPHETRSGRACPAQGSRNNARRRRPRGRADGGAGELILGFSPAASASG